MYKSSAITNSNYNTIKVVIKNEMTQNIQVQKSPQQNTMLVQLSKFSIFFNLTPFASDFSKIPRYPKIV